MTQRASPLYRLSAGLTLALLLGGCGEPRPVPDNRAAAQAPALPPPPPPPPAPPAPAPQPATPSRDDPGYAALPEIQGDNWQSLFDGQTLQGWKITDFGGHGEVKVEKGQIIMEMGAMLTGVSGPTNLFKTDYELTLDAMKLSGSDFFCGLTFPVADACCSLIVGGWGGGLVGISSLDGNDASSNETTKYMNFEAKRWYRIRVRVTPQKLQAWIGEDKVVDVALEGRRVGMRPGEIEIQQPLGICTYQTTGAVRGMQWRKL